MVECLTGDRGLQVRASPEALHFVLEQDTIVCLVIVQPWKTRPDMTEKNVDGDVKKQTKSLKILMEIVNHTYDAWFQRQFLYSDGQVGIFVHLATQITGVE